MKIVFLTEFYPVSEQADVRGGVEMRTWQLSQRVGHHHQVTVMAVREKQTPAESRLGSVNVKRVGPVAVFRQGGGYIARLRYVWAASRIIRRQPADVIIAENFLGYVVAWLLPARLRAKTMLTYHDVWLGQWIKNVGLIFGLVGELVERIVIMRSWPMYIANSQATAEKLRQHSVPADKIQVLYNGIDYDHFQTIAPEQFPQATIVVVARLVGYKKIDDLLHAFKIVLADRPVRLVVIGSGPDQQRLQKIAEELDIAGHVEWRLFVPNHDQVLAAIKGATVFCLPSAVEGMGIVTLEAMACGTPYVSSDIPPTREITANGQGGLLYPVGDISALAGLLEQMLDDEPTRHQCRAQGLAQAQKFDWAKISHQFERLLQQFGGRQSTHIAWLIPK